MRTKENYRGELFDVTFDKLLHTSDGMGFILKREEDIDGRMMEVLGTDIHLANVGCAIFFKNEPRNVNELEYIPFESSGYIVEEIYSMIEEGECLWYSISL